jgi:hypothetical protein
MKYSLFTLMTLLLWSGLGFAQTLLVSDVDDTIKLAHVQSYQDMVRFGLDEKSRFMGMSELYNFIKRDNPDMQIVYLSRAPKWLMQTRHLKFLKNGSFPAGRYIGRSEYSAETHKIESLRKLMAEFHPKKVILFGDNGEFDPQVYAQISDEFRRQGVLFYTFIRVAYSKNIFSLGGSPLALEQIGFVTPIEISLELERQGLMQKASVEKLLKLKGPDLSDENLKGKNYEYAFPYFVECSDFRWRWDDRLTDLSTLGTLKKRIYKRCGLK